MLLSAVISILAIIIGYLFKAALIILALLFIFMLVFVIYKQGKSIYILTFAFPFLICLSMIITFGKIGTLSKFESQKDICKFTVKEITYENQNLSIATIRIDESEKLPKGSNLTLFYDKNNLSVGDIAKGKLKLSKISSKYQLSSYSEGSYLSASCYDYEKLNETDSFLKGVSKVREYISKTLFENLDYNEFATMTALCFGEKSYFTDTFSQNVKASGVSHVMVVSGMHLSILVTFFTFLINKLFYNKYLNAFVRIFVVIILCFLCGFTMSIIRAGVMYLVTALGIILNRKGDSANSLGTACVLILTFAPLAIFNIGFLLSLLSTFGILSISLPISRYLKERDIIKNPILASVVFALLTSLAATVLVTPIIIYFYGYISLFGVLTTFLISYAVTVTIWICVTALLINLVLAPFSDILFFVLNYILKYINFIINKLAGIPFATLNTPTAFTFVAIFIIIVIFYFMFACKKRIDMLKLKEIRTKMIKEGGDRIRWQ